MKLGFFVVAFEEDHTNDVVCGFVVVVVVLTVVHDGFPVTKSILNEKRNIKIYRKIIFIIIRLFVRFTYAKWSGNFIHLYCNSI